MPNTHRLGRLFTKETKERLEIYFLILQLFLAVLAILIQLWG
jgi:hypothetical protein